MERKTFFSFYLFSFCPLVTSNNLFLLVFVVQIRSFPSCHRMIIFHWSWACDRPSLLHVSDPRFETLDRLSEGKLYDFWNSLIFLEPVSPKIDKTKRLTRRFKQSAMDSTKLKDDINVKIVFHCNLLKKNLEFSKKKKLVC